MINYTNIIKQDNKLIRKISKEIIFPLNDKIHKIVKLMKQYVQNSIIPEKAKKYNLLPAVGIASIQIGHAKRIFYCYNRRDNLDLMIINPVVIRRSFEYIYLLSLEGCLSVPNSVNGYVLRNKSITIKGYNYYKKIWEEKTYFDYNAVIIQHELDHLRGKLYIDKIISKNDPFGQIGFSKGI